MYTSINRQRGMGWFGMTLVFGAIAFVAIMVVKVGPLHMNHMTVVRVLTAVADDPEMGSADPSRIRNTLERRSDIDYIPQIDDKDIKIKRTDKGRVLAYAFEARV